MTLVLPRPHGGHNWPRGINEHFLRIQQELEQNDRKLESRLVDVTDQARTTYTSDTTIQPGISLVVVDASSAAVTITLPSLATAYQPVTVIKGDTSGNTVTVAAAGSDTMLAAGVSSIVMTQPDSAARLLPLEKWRYG